MRMTFRRRKRAAAQTAAESLPIQGLVVRQIVRGEYAPGKEAFDIRSFRIRILHALVVKAETLEQSFVLVGERRFFHAAVIPENDDPSARFKNAGKFAAGGPRVVPVENLGRGNGIARCVA